jgi:hypothetical protein
MGPLFWSICTMLCVTPDSVLLSRQLPGLLTCPKPPACPWMEITEVTSQGPEDAKSPAQSPVTHRLLFSEF